MVLETTDRVHSQKESQSFSLAAIHPSYGLLWSENIQMCHLPDGWRPIQGQSPQ